MNKSHPTYREPPIKTTLKAGLEAALISFPLFLITYCSVEPALILAVVTGLGTGIGILLAIMLEK